MKKLFIILTAVFGMTVAANAAEYTIDDSAIDALIENAIEVSAPAQAAPVSAASAFSSSSKNPAVVLCLNFFLGEFGIHRHYLGTSKFMWAIYLVTAGGICGIVPLIDLITEIVDLVEGGDLSQFCNNTKFFMWA